MFLHAVTGTSTQHLRLGRPQRLDGHDDAQPDVCSIAFSCCLKLRYTTPGLLDSGVAVLAEPKIGGTEDVEI